MKKGLLVLPFLMMAILLSACQNKPANNKKENARATAKEEQRIISLNGAITEIVWDTGHGKELVGRDVTSTYPQWVKDSVKDLGHVRSLTMEAIMALHPTLILASDRDMNPKLKKSIKESGVRFKLFHQDFSVEGTKALIKEVAEFIGGGETQPLFNKIDADLSKVTPFSKKPKVLFVYARGAGTMLVAGADTPMDKIIALAGGTNAAKQLDGYKPLVGEALIEIDPDVILLFNSGLRSLGGTAGFIKSVPALSQTKAGKNGAVVTMEGGLLSDFGPRVGLAAYQLNQLLMPYAK